MRSAAKHTVKRGAHLRKRGCKTQGNSGQVYLYDGCDLSGMRGEKLCACEVWKEEEKKQEKGGMRQRNTKKTTNTHTHTLSHIAQ